MDGISLRKAEFFNPNNPGPEWRVVAAGDLQKNGKVDLVFQHSNGALAVWFLKGLNLIKADKIFLPEGLDPGWRVKTLVDLDKCGTVELVVQHTDGRLAAWAINGIMFKSAQSLTPENPGPGWQVVGPK